jgi:predicted TIM-barrel fold metal-dependent hydrolase
MAEPVSEPLQTTPMRAAESNTRPRFQLPAGSCDAHFHVFEPGYAHVDKIQYTFPDGNLEQYLRVADYLGIERMVLVQPSYYGTDNRLTIDVLRKVGSSCRGVVQVDDDISDAELDSYHDAGVRAIRLDLFSRAALATSEIGDYVRRMGERTGARGWHLQFYAPGRIVRDLLPFLADFDKTFVIDHMGYMKETDGLTSADQDRLIEVFEQNDNFWIKLSGAYRIAQYNPLSTVEALGRRLVAARSDRLCWGSDWPHLPDGQRDTGVYLNLLADWAPNAVDRHKILVDSADALFFAH